MLAASSYLRSIPRALDLRERLALEVILNASDAISIAHERLLETLRNIDTQSSETFDDMTRAKLGIDCWTIVDNAHALFQVVRKLPSGNAFSSHGLMDQYGRTVSAMRNGMDHIHQNINNLAGKKGTRMPLYGSVTFTSPLGSDLTFEMRTVPIGGLQFSEQAFGVFDTWARPLADDVGNISFEAFENRLTVSEMIGQLQAALIEFDADLRDKLSQLVAECAQTQGLRPSDIENETVRGGLIASLRFKLSE